MMSVLARSCLTAAAALTSLAICSRSLAQTAYIGTNFSGSYYGSTSVGAVPPDTMGAAGPNNYVELLNGVFATYTKTGTLVGTRTTDSQFWTDAFTNAGTPFNPGTAITDPRLIYDQTSQRWFAVEVTTTSPDYQIMVARSNTSDPTQGFKAVRFSATAAGGTFPDYPTLGIDANGLYIGANFFPDNNSTATVGLYSIPKADLLLTTPSADNRTSFLNKAIGQYGWTPQPVVDFASTKGPALVYAVSTDAPSNTTTLRKYTVSGSDAAGATLSSALSITVPSYTAPPVAQQPGTSLGLDGLDGRIQANVYQVRNDIWAVQTVSSGTHDVIRWYHINASNNTVIATGTLSDPGFDCTQPSICANASGAVVIAFTRSGTNSSTGNPGSYAFVGTTVGSATTFGAIMQLKAGAGSYVADPSSSPQRWGDYSATTPDPADPGIFWTSQEYARAGGNVWGVQNTEIIVPDTNEARWKTAASGGFSSTANWLTGTLPDVNSHVIFSRPGAPYTVTLGVPTTINRLSARQGDVTVNLGGAALTLANVSQSAPSLIVGEFGSSPRLTIRNGTLASNITEVSPNPQSDGGLTLDNVAWTSGADVTLGNAAAAPAFLKLTGTSSAQIAGTLSLYHNTTLTNTATTLTAGAINVPGGRIVDYPAATPPGSRVLRTNSLSITDGGQIDLNDNGLIYDYTGSPSAAESLIRCYLISGRNCGTWDGPGLASTTAKGDPTQTTALAYAQASELGITSFAGQPVDATTVIVKYTLLGDINMNGVIDAQDYQLLDEAYYGFYYASWFHGDFNYDGVIDSKDFLLIDISYGRQQGLSQEFISERDAQFGDPYVQELLDSIPEPAGLACLAAVIPLVTRRRQR